MSNNFFNLVYEMVKTIPKGKVTSYGTIARMCGNPKMARQVGWALHVNPYYSVVPCHRVVTKQGRLAPSFAFGGSEVQRQMLLDEGVEVGQDDIVDMNIYGYNP